MMAFGEDFAGDSNLDRLLTLKVVVGVMGAFCSTFVPDEFWQSTEVGYYLAFGKGHLTWEWLTGLRSQLVPSIIGLYYSIVEKTLGNPTFGMMVYGPQIIQVILSIYATNKFLAFVQQKQEPSVARITRFFYIADWFTTYCFARTITNQTELSLNMLGLYYLHNERPKTFAFVLVLNFFIRPTSAIFWIPYFPVFLETFDGRQIFLSVLTSVATALSLCFWDCEVYGKFVLTPWEFFRFNFLSGGSANFGTHHFLWYYYAGVPAVMHVLGCLLPLGVLFYKTRRDALNVVFFITVFSFIPHKEFRFLLPVLPLVFMVGGEVLFKIYEALETLKVLGSVENRQRVYKRLATVLYVSSFLVAGLTGAFHQSGYQQVAASYNNAQAFGHPVDSNKNGWVITPCYSMPVHTFMAKPELNLVYYICPPEMYRGLYDFSNSSNYIFQKDSFHEQDLKADLQAKYSGHGRPDWIITLHHKADVVRNVLYELDKTNVYTAKHTALHTLFPERVYITVLVPDNDGTVRKQKEDGRMHSS